MQILNQNYLMHDKLIKIGTKHTHQQYHSEVSKNYFSSVPRAVPGGGKSVFVGHNIKLHIFFKISVTPSDISVCTESVSILG